MRQKPGTRKSHGEKVVDKGLEPTFTKLRSASDMRAKLFGAQAA